MDTRPGDSFADIGKGSEAMKSLEQLPKQLAVEKPNAIVVVTAHWERYTTLDLSSTSFMATKFIISILFIFSQHFLFTRTILSSKDHDEEGINQGMGCA